MVELAYKYQPSGQEGPNRNRNYVKPRDGLVEVLKQFLDNFRSFYETTTETAQETP